MKILFKVSPALFLYKICFSKPVVFSDGFEGISIDTTKWNVVQFGGGGSISVSGGVCDLKNGTAYGQGYYIESKTGVYPPAKIVFRIKTSLDNCWYYYAPAAGFKRIFFCEDNEAQWGSNWVDGQPFESIWSTWKTDSIIWTSTAIKWYVEGSLVYTVTTGIPVDCEAAYFYQYIDLLSGGSVYDLWIDTVYMEGAECPGGVEEETEKQIINYRLDVTNPIQNGRGELNFSIPNDEYISLILYDVTGRQEKILVDKNLEKGSHKVKLDSSLRTGIYFVRLEYKGNTTKASSPCGKISKKIMIF